jgi:hypothetical protein
MCPRGAHIPTSPLRGEVNRDCLNVSETRIKPGIECLCICCNGTDEGDGCPVFQNFIKSFAIRSWPEKCFLAASA